MILVKCNKYNLNSMVKGKVIRKLHNITGDWMPLFCMSEINLNWVFMSWCHGLKFWAFPTSLCSWTCQLPELPPIWVQRGEHWVLDCLWRIQENQIASQEGWAGQENLWGIYPKWCSQRGQLATLKRSAQKGMQVFQGTRHWIWDLLHAKQVHYQ